MIQLLALELSDSAWFWNFIFSPHLATSQGYDPYIPAQHLELFILKWGQPQIMFHLATSQRESVPEMYYLMP